MQTIKEFIDAEQLSFGDKVRSPDGFVWTVTQGNDAYNTMYLKRISGGMGRGGHIAGMLFDKISIPGLSREYSKITLRRGFIHKRREGASIITQALFKDIRGLQSYIKYHNLEDEIGDYGLGREGVYNVSKSCEGLKPRFWKVDCTDPTLVHPVPVIGEVKCKQF